MSTFDWASGYSHFPSVLFKRVFTPIKRPVARGAAIVTAYTDGQVTLRSRRAKIGYREAADTSTYKGVEPGDFVVHGLDILRGSVGVSDSSGAISPVCTVCVASDEADGRFVAYAMRAQALAGLPRALARGVREGGADFRRWDTLGELPIPLPPKEEQVRIADFLDANGALLDQAVAVRQGQVALLRKRMTALVDETFAPWVNRTAAAAVCERIVDCVNKTAPTSDEPTAYKMIRTSNVRDGRVNLEEVLTVDADTFATWNRRGAPRRGDVILTREAPVGEVGLLDSDEPVFLGQRTILYRANPAKAMPEFIALALMSEDVRQQMGVLGAGSLHPHLRVGDCLKLKLPLMSLAEQEATVPQLLERRDSTVGLMTRMNAQVALLTERKHALITAAVTGAFDVTTARSVA